jgi:hypothetical protein
LFSGWITLCKKKKLPCSDEEKYSLADTLGEPIKIQVQLFIFSDFSMEFFVRF